MTQRSMLTRMFSCTSTKRRLIAEPTTSLTNVALMLQTFLYAYLLRKSPAYREKSVRAWSFTMTAVGIAALAGAVTHSLYHDSSVQWVTLVRNAAWKLVGLSTALASGGMLIAAVFSSVPPGKRVPYIVLTSVKTVVFAGIAWVSGDFLYTIVDYAISMLVVLLVQIRQWRTGLAAPWLTAGILVSFVAAGLQRSGIVFSQHFNFNDIYHIIQIGAFHLLYEGARRQKDCDSRLDK